MSLPEPNANPTLMGHEAALQEVAAAFQGGRLPQAWLLSGPEGIGKATFAYHVANYVMSEGKNPMGHLAAEHPVARLIAAEAHPDLFVLKRRVDEKTGALQASISAEAARKMGPFLHRTATQGRWRLAIVDEAQLLGRFGQNALLKVIEEPPRNSLILITTTTVGALLPTIRSRCRVLSLNPLSEGEMKALLAAAGADVSGDELQRVVRLSGGSVGFALNLLENQVLPLYDALLDLLRSMPNPDEEKVQAMAEQVGRRGEEARFDALTKLLMSLLQGRIRESARKNEGACLDYAIQLWEKVSRIFAMADEANLDRKLAFLNALAEIRRASA